MSSPSPCVIGLILTLVSALYRCVVCTLPGGTCEHTPGWVRFAFESRQEDPVEAELKRLTEVVEENAVNGLQSPPTTAPSMPAFISVR